MAELILKVGDSLTHRDGEVLSAFSRRRIMQVHAEHICHVRRAGFWTEFGHRPIGLCYHYQDAVFRYCFARVSRTEIVREDRQTGRIETFGKIPTCSDGNWQSIDVPEFVSRRLLHHNHRMFGEPGREIWFGGKQDYSSETMVFIWKRITMATGIQPDRLTWPAGQMDLRNHLVLALSHDLSDDESSGLIGTRIAWRSMLPVSLIRQVDKPGQYVDLRRHGVSVSLRRRLLEVAA